MGEATADAGADAGVVFRSAAEAAAVPGGGKI